ncbi:MAG TPA: SPOR domain-containing protein [Desulfobacteraceae bacterium]|nr:SPOR domain-containing protein [Desulfobacteraceae bacterium]HPJ68278.1 SPOR domain-containing protein [Desulfobacteraceae bacterium]
MKILIKMEVFMHFDRGLINRDNLSRICLVMFLLCLLPCVVLCGCRTEADDKDLKNTRVVVRQKIEFQEELPAENEVEAEPAVQEIKVEENSIPETEISKPEPGLTRENAVSVRRKDGFYIIQKGDSLFAVADRSDVYGDSLKWVSLFRINFKELKGFMAAEDGFEHQMLPEGLELRYVTEKEAVKNSSMIGNKCWVVNVFSSQDPEKIAMPAISLIKNGYHAYLAFAEVKGKKWIRLRVGFYGDRSDARSEKKKIMALLKMNDIWIDRIDHNELIQFAGY